MCLSFLSIFYPSILFSLPIHSSLIFSSFFSLIFLLCPSTLFLQQFIHPAICPSVFLFICFHPFFHQLRNSSLDPWVLPSPMRPSIHPSILLCISPLSFSPPLHPSTHPLVSLHPTYLSFLHPSTFSLHLSPCILPSTSPLSHN